MYERAVGRPLPSEIVIENEAWLTNPNLGGGAYFAVGIADHEVFLSMIADMKLNSSVQDAPFFTRPKTLEKEGWWTPPLPSDCLENGDHYGSEYRLPNGMKRQVTLAYRQGRIYFYVREL